jgi:plastocyanin
VNVGGTVVWWNNSHGTHTVTSDVGSPEVFDSNNVMLGSTFSHTFNTAGTFTYHCKIHTTMHGTIVVGGG